MKPYVTILLGFGGQEHAISFEKIEEIDDLLSTLEDARAELEHQIEMEKQRNREKRKRKKMREKQWIEQQEQELKENTEQFIDSLNIGEKISIPELDYEKIADLLNGIRKGSEEEKEYEITLKESLYNITKGMYNSMDENTKKILKPLIDEFDKIYKSQLGLSSSLRK